MKLTKEQANCIESFLKNKEDGKEKLLSLHACKIHSKKGWQSSFYSSLNELSIDQIATALYVGYEVEDNKNERLIKLFNTLNSDRNNSISPMVRIISEEAIKNILEVLDILEVKIEGIN